MKNIKIIAIITLSIVFTLNLKAQDFKKYYAGVNVVAPFASMECSKFLCLWNFIGSSFSNREYGAALNAGFYFKEYQAIELRYSRGKSPLSGLNSQTHLGYNIHFLQHINRNKARKYRGLYAGIFVSVVDDWDIDEHSLFSNFFSYFTVGYRLDNKKNPLYLDLRFNQVIFSHGIYIGSFQGVHVGGPDNYVHGTKLFSLPPALSLNIGCQF